MNNSTNSPSNLWQRSLLAAAFLALLTLGVTGCNRGPAIRESSAFDSADPALKSKWQLAVATGKTNGYSIAYSTLMALQSQPNLTPEQAKAVEDLLGAVGARISIAANKGDPEAVKALREINTATSRRGR